MGSIKVIIDEEIEREFRRVAMKSYGYGKGALSKAAEAAFAEWSLQEDVDVTARPGLEDPVAAIEDILKHVRTSSVELQHEASKIRVKRAYGKISG
jgi:hypothetical protein